MRSINWLFCSLLTVVVFIGCAPPIGYISGDNGTGHEELLALPYRIVYDINSLFRRNRDVSIFTSYRGALQPISTKDKDVKISVIENPSAPDTLIEVPVDEDYPLEKRGRKVIVIEYKGLEASYSIEVQDPLGLTDPNGEGNIQIGNGGIIWVYPGKK